MDPLENLEFEEAAAGWTAQIANPPPGGADSLTSALAAIFCFGRRATSAAVDERDLTKEHDVPIQEVKHANAPHAHVPSDPSLSDIWNLSNLSRQNETRFDEGGRKAQLAPRDARPSKI